MDVGLADLSPNVCGTIEWWRYLRPTVRHRGGDEVVGKLKHPGEALRDQMVNAGLGVVELAKSIGVSRQQLHLMLCGARFSAMQAVRLEDVFDVPASQWLALQIENDLAEARRRYSRIMRVGDRNSSQTQAVTTSPGM